MVNKVTLVNMVTITPRLDIAMKATHTLTGNVLNNMTNINTQVKQTSVTLTVHTTLNTQAITMIKHFRMTPSSVPYDYTHNQPSYDYSQYVDIESTNCQTQHLDGGTPAEFSSTREIVI